LIVILGFFKRKADLTHQQFSDHWRNVHGPLIRSIPGVGDLLLRYVQHHLTPEPHHSAPDAMAYDGFSEGWFKSAESFDELRALPFFVNECIEDERKFLDMSATRWVVLDEQVVIIP
jgi:uncharacterized protein (TIGR02118 family)